MMEAKKPSWVQGLVRVLGPVGKKAPKAEPIVSLEYSNAIEELANTRKDRRFFNFNDNQARLVAWLMIRDARSTDQILIYSKALSHPFYSVILRASYMYDSKPVFRIILDEKEGIDVIKKLPEDMQSRIECRLATTQDGGHMLLTPVAFRAEKKACHDELDVVCNFYEPEKVQEIKVRFERIWANAVPISAA